MTLSRIMYGTTQRMLSGFYKKCGDNGKVFMFHQVNDKKEIWKDERFCITQKGFEEFIESIRFKYIPESISNMANNVEMAHNHRRKSCYITFDDAYADVVLEALPVMEKYEVPFGIFLTVDLIDKDGYITTSMLDLLVAHRLCTIGSHGLSHIMTRYAIGEKAKQEIEGSKRRLEQITNREVKYFAFPYGSVYACSKRDRKMVIDAGYKIGFSTVGSPLNSVSCKDRAFLPRINVNQKNYKRLV